MAMRRALIRPRGGRKVLTLRVRVSVDGLPAGARVDVADVMLQAGSVATGWQAHVTELPWSAGVVGGP